MGRGRVLLVRTSTRVFQLVLSDDGSIRYDYISSTAPDNSPNAAFVGLSSGTSPRDVNTVGRSPYTFLRADLDLPSATVRVQSTAGFAIPGSVYVNGVEVTCTGKTAVNFTGCTSVSAQDFVAANRVGVYQPLATAAKSVLYTPIDAPAIPAPAGKVTLTLPAGSSLNTADPACSETKAPTAKAAGLVSCDTPALAVGEDAILSVTWIVPPNMGNGQDTPPNVEAKALYMPSGAPRATDIEEANFGGDVRPTTMQPELTFTGAPPVHPGDALTFHSAPHPVLQGLGSPVLKIQIPQHVRLTGKTFPNCSPSPSGFGGGTVTCRLPNGLRDLYSGDLTFKANAAGTYKPKVTYSAVNAPTASKRATVTVSP